MPGGHPGGGGLGGAAGDGGGEDGGKVVQSQTAGRETAVVAESGMVTSIGDAVFAILVSVPHCWSLMETTGVERLVAFSSVALCTLDSKVVTVDVMASSVEHAGALGGGTDGDDCRRRPSASSLVFVHNVP